MWSCCLVSWGVHVNPCERVLQRPTTFQTRGQHNTASVAHNCVCSCNYSNLEARCFPVGPTQPPKYEATLQPTGNLILSHLTHSRISRTFACRRLHLFIVVVHGCIFLHTVGMALIEHQHLSSPTLAGLCTSQGTTHLKATATFKH